MKLQVCATLSIIALYEAQGFVLPSPSPKLVPLGRFGVFVPKRPSLVVRFSMAMERTEWKDLQQFNVELDRLAELSGKHGQPVISRAAECEAAWEQQVHNHDSSRTLKPDTVSFNTVLKAWNKCCQALVDSDRNQQQLPQEPGHSVPVYTPRDAVERATSLLLKQLDNKDGAVPDAASFNVVIDAWAKSGVDEAPQAAERLLKLMKTSKGVEPDSLSYHGVLDAWAHAGTEESLVRVKQIYQHMQGLYADGKDVKPSIRTVNVMVHAHGRVAANFISNPNLYDPEKAFQAAEAAHELLRQMRAKFEETNDPDFAPDVMTYTSVMDAFARCGTFKGTQRAGQLLAELKQQYQKTQNPRLRPNVRTYTSLISAWSRTNSPEAPVQAEALLKEMYDNPAIRPNSRTFTSVIQCWGKSRDSTKAKRALKILRDMKELYKKVGDEDIRPNIITYNSAITACAMVQGTPEQQTEALKISFAILKAIEADDSVQTNHATFSTLIKGVGYLMPAGEERNKVAKAVFDKARTAGLVDTFVVTNLRKAVDAKVMQEIFTGIAPDRNGDYDFTRIPADWSKNVK